ncbi:MAG: hypothetical protein KDA99_18855, partial [Planctomycetales bacterium]|nr:hypothetical protein [Planctomycetales bacterium]
MPTRSGLCSILVDGNRPKLIVTVAVFAMALSSDSTVAQDKVAQPDIDKQVSELLTKLELLQQTDQSGEDEWARTIRDLIKLGPDAVPSLSQALRDTPYENRRMLRSIPFVLRGIGDARAVPALIESLIKCYGQDGSDMGYNTADPELLAFMRNHDDDLTDLDPNGYNWGRPINEVRTALQVLTGKEFNTSE